MGVRTLVTCVFLVGGSGEPAEAQLPLRQSSLDERAPKHAFTLQEVSRNDRLIGTGVRDVRWSPDGSTLYFRWTETPRTTDDPEMDPWYRTSADGRSANRIADSLSGNVPGADIDWSTDGRVAAWTTTDGRLMLYDASMRHGPAIRGVVAGVQPVRRHVVWPNGSAVDLMLGEDAFRYDVASASLRRMTRIVHRGSDARTDEAKWLSSEQDSLFAILRERRARDMERRQRGNESAAQIIALPDNITVEESRLSPDGRLIVLRTRSANRQRPQTLYMDYVTASGYAESKQSRGKAGEPRDAYRLGIARVSPSPAGDTAAVRWIELPEAGNRAVAMHGPWWSLEGDRAVIEVISQDDKDLWIATLDPATGRTTVIDHQHDDAWLGGPPIQSNNINPGLLEWLPGGRLVFASEKSGWSHLYLAERDGAVRALTSGNWEVRAAQLSRDKSRWLLMGSREHPADDHLYVMPAAGGDLVQLTSEQGHDVGALSPDGRRLAVLHSRTDQMPDLWLRDATPSATSVRVTRSGTDLYWQHRWRRPEVVQIPHPGGGVVWGALYKPDQPNPTHPAVIYVHGGGYRQFVNRGYSYYGYSHASHYGMLNYLVEQGYTVLDFDYRGSSGYGRDYRTDIYRSMGAKDVDGAVAAAKWLSHTQGVDSTRIGIYGVSYGGFMTLMSLFKHPGIFAAGISAAGVTDWAHYSDEWTSRILNRPYEDPAAYRASSPIYFANGLKDALLIEHGIVDDNVEFQDAVRLEQRLLELEKSFDIIYYPLEPHVIESEPALLDFHKRLTAFFSRHLLRDGR